MSSKTYLWIEDKKDKAAYTFWNCFLHQLYPYIELESKNNSSKLVKAVSKIKDCENKYIIVCDNSFDNLQVAMERKRLKEYVDKMDNIVMIDIICFEYILLEFKDLIDWIYAPDDEFISKRAVAISAREKLLNSLENGIDDYKDLKDIVEYDKVAREHNIEQLSARLLFDLTRNTGFEVTKGKIGDCWINSCCDWEERMEDDVCGLDKNRPSIYDKMKEIYEGTCLKEQLCIAGLEVAV